jgi:hypothetical protein
VPYDVTLGRRDAWGLLEGYFFIKAKVETSLSAKNG